MNSFEWQCSQRERAAKARAIREYAAAHPYELVIDMAALFGLHPVTISLILNGKRWRDAGGPLEQKNKTRTREAAYKSSLDRATAREVYRRVQADGAWGAVTRVARAMGLPYQKCWQIANRQAYAWATSDLWVKERRGQRIVPPPAPTLTLTKLS